MNWKPSTCADCPAKHPSLSHDGKDGPWRCKPCHDRAAPRDKTVRVTPAPAPPQGRLL